MAAYVYLHRLDEDLISEQPITIPEWEACVQSLEDVRLVGSGEQQQLELYQEETEQWQGFMWLNASGEAYTTAARLFRDAERDNQAYSLAMQLAQCLGACLQGEEGQLYYWPMWHAYFWEATEAVPEVSLDEVRAYRDRFGSDATLVAERLAQLLAEAVGSSPVLPVHLTPPRSTGNGISTYGWLVGLGLAVLLGMIYYLQ